MKKSPIDGTNVNIIPDNNPGNVSFNVTVKNAFGADDPRSLAASTKDQSIFSTLEYTAKIINGKSAYIIPMTTAG